MARSRMVKPEFFTDPKIGRLSREARLLYVGLWCLADDIGNVSTEPAFVRAHLLPYDDDVTLVHVERWLAELADSGRLRPYRIADERYATIGHFQRHQKINRPSDWRNPMPVPEQTSLLEEGSRRAHGGLTEGSALETVNRKPETVNRKPKSSLSARVREGERQGGAAKARALPPIWEPDASLLAWAKAKVPMVDPSRETEKFRNHADANGRTAKNWAAAWRNWMLKADELKPPAARGQHGSNGSGYVPYRSPPSEAYDDTAI